MLRARMKPSAAQLRQYSLELVVFGHPLDLHIAHAEISAAGRVALRLLTPCLDKAPGNGRVLDPSVPTEPGTCSLSSQKPGSYRQKIR